MLHTVRKIAAHLEGKAMGMADLEIAQLRSIDEAVADAICPLMEKRFLVRVKTLPRAVLTTPKLAQFALEAGIAAAVIHDQPTSALAGLIDLFYPPQTPPSGIHPSAFVDTEARVHPTATVSPSAVVESGAQVGENTFIGPGAVICAGCRIGKHVHVGPGAVIGSDGFGYVPGPKGPTKIRHVGSVVIEDYVEIGANSCVDRATIGTTIVGQSSKLDNLVQVGHNTHIAKRVLIAGQAGLAGSTVVGDDAMLGGQAGVKDHVTIGARAKVAGQSGVIGDVADDSVVAGYPAIERARWLRTMAWLVRKSDHSPDGNGEDS